MHPTAAKGFVTPDVYERGRPDYPQPAVDALGLHAGMRVADLGCGTGKLTRSLQATGADVVGIEPLPGMLAAFHTALPDVHVAHGLAEAIPFADATFDLVVCASAFHWFDHAIAIPEIWRVLRDDGTLAILWNRRDRIDGWASGFFDISERCRGDTPGYRSGTWETAIERSELFGALQEQAFHHVQRTDLDGLLARVASISFIETLPADEKRAVLEESKRYIETHPETRDLEFIDLPYRTVLYTAARLPST